MLTKRQLKEAFEKYNFRPIKRFGENYLIDGNIKDKIIAEAQPSKGDVILEIGPGLGALTIDLARSGASVFAVEKDKKAFSILTDIVGTDLPNLKIFNGDILDFDFKTIAAAGKIKVVGNLPYYLTTPIIERLIDNAASVESILIVIQKEVGRRLTAGAGSEDYGSISCYVQYYTKADYIYTIKRTSFWPEPNVDSSLVRLKVLAKPSVNVKDESLLFKIIRGAFNQRRKSIINSLSREAVLDLGKEELAGILHAIGIDPVARPETLTLSDFAVISNSVG